MESTTPRLLALPTELRLRIYDYANSNMRRNGKGHIGNSVHLTVIGKWSVDAVTLSRTCRQIHQEVSDHIYANKSFYVRVSNYEKHIASSMTRWTQTPDLSFLSNVHTLYLYVYVTYEHDVAEQNAMMEQALVQLRDSTKLRFIMSGYKLLECDFDNPTRVQRLQDQVRQSRRATMSEVQNAGKSRTQAEVDFGFKVVELLKHSTFPEWVVED